MKLIKETNINQLTNISTVAVLLLTVTALRCLWKDVISFLQFCGFGSFLSANCVQFPKARGSL